MPDFETASNETDQTNRNINSSDLQKPELPLFHQAFDSQIMSAAATRPWAVQNLDSKSELDTLLAHSPAKDRDNSGNAFTDGVRAIAYNAIQSPITGLSQIVDKSTGSDLASSTHFIDAPQPAQFGSLRWHSQQVGGAAGMLVPFLLVARGTRGAIGSFGNASKLASAESSALTQLAKSSSTLSGTGKSVIFDAGKRMAVAEQGLNGFIFDAALRPSDMNSDSFISDRLKHGMVGAATFSTLTASSITLRHLSRIPANAPGFNNFLKRDLATGALSGVPAGVVAAQGTSLLERGRFAGAKETLESAYGMAVIGGSLSAMHVIPGRQRTLSELDTRKNNQDGSGTAKLRESLEAKTKEQSAAPQKLGHEIAENGSASKAIQLDLLSSRGTSAEIVAARESTRLGSFDANTGKNKSPVLDGTFEPKVDIIPEQKPTIVETRSEVPGSKSGAKPEQRTEAEPAINETGRSSESKPSEGAAESSSQRAKDNSAENPQKIEIESREKPQETTSEAQLYRFGEHTVKVEYSRVSPEGVIEVKLAENVGYNPKGTIIRIYEGEKFPDGLLTENGNFISRAEHPDGTVVFTRPTGNAVWFYPEPVTINYESGNFSARRVEQLPDKTEIWTTTDGARVEIFPKDAAVKTALGEVNRIDNLGDTRRYFTLDGKIFDLVQSGENLKLIEYFANRAPRTTELNSFKEVFPEATNMSRWGEITERMIYADGLEVALVDGSKSFRFASTRTVEDGRIIVDGIRYKDGSTTYFLQDGTFYGVRPSQNLAQFDWVSKEWNRPDGAEVLTLKNGDRLSYEKNGNTVETFAGEQKTSLGSFVKITRTAEKSTYEAADGSRVEFPNKSDLPVIKYDADGKPTLLDVKSITEVYPDNRYTQMGLVKSIEYMKDGTSRWIMDQSGAGEVVSVTFFDAPRFGFTGYAQLKNGNYVPMSKDGFLQRQMDSRTLEELLNNGNLPD